MATAGSITALFLRGFTIKGYTEQLKNKDLETPTMQVYLLETQGYNSKMDAYKAGIAAAGNGLGVYVLPEEGKWTWVAGVYLTEAECNEMIENQNNLPEKIMIKNYQITGKKIPISSEAIEPAQQILSAVQNVFNLLLNLRAELNQGNDIKNLQLELTTVYNQIKSNAEILQELNTNLQNQLIATVIYTANQNILTLQEIIYNDDNSSISLASINTTLLKTIFSLDNF